MSKYEMFIKGEIMDLCCPTEKAIYDDKWHSWFNDPKTTRFLNQGIFPNTIEDQLDYLESMRKNKGRILLLIKPKELEKIVGVASLSNIDYRHRKADFAMVLGNRNYKARYKQLIGMEAKCRMIEHAFETVGLERINGSQVAGLSMWQRWQVLFGYRIEGIQRKAFRKGHKVYDVFITSVLLEDYLKLKKLRNGSFWPGAERLMQLIKLLPKESYDRIIEEILNQAWSKYYNALSLV